MNVLEVFARRHYPYPVGKGGLLAAVLARSCAEVLKACQMCAARTKDGELPFYFISLAWQSSRHSAVRAVSFWWRPFSLLRDKGVGATAGHHAHIFLPLGLTGRCLDISLRISDREAAGSQARMGYGGLYGKPASCCHPDKDEMAGERALSGAL